MPGKGFRDQRGKVGVRQLAGREVDGHPTGWAYALSLPLRELTAGLVEHPGAEVEDQTALLGQRDELVGLEQSSAWMLPADQGLDAEQRAGGRRRRWAGSAGRADRSRSPYGAPARRRPARRPPPHVTVEQRDPVAAEVLGLVHRDVRVADQRARVDARSARDSDADARCRLDRVLLVDDRLGGGSRPCALRCAGRRSGPEAPRRAWRTRHRRAARRCPPAAGRARAACPPYAAAGRPTCARGSR